MGVSAKLPSRLPLPLLPPLRPLLPLERAAAKGALKWSACDNGYWGRGGPCCKCEEALRFVVDSERGHRLMAVIKWLVFSDDDMYYAPQPFSSFLGRHDHTLVQAMGPSAALGAFTVYPSRTHCTHPGAKSVTLQPVVLSVAALRHVKPGVLAGGVTQQCGAFNSTHDAGLSVFLWMHAVPLQRELGLVLSGLEKWTREGLDPAKSAMHRVKFTADFDFMHKAWSDEKGAVDESREGEEIPIVGGGGAVVVGEAEKGRRRSISIGKGDGGDPPRHAAGRRGVTRRTMLGTLDMPPSSPSGSGGGVSLTPAQVEGTPPGSRGNRSLVDRETRDSKGGEGGRGASGSGASSEGAARVAAAMAFLDSLGSAPDPKPQHGYLATQHHKRQQRSGGGEGKSGGGASQAGEAGKAALGVREHLGESGAWPLFQPSDCML